MKTGVFAFGHASFEACVIYKLFFLAVSFLSLRAEELQGSAVNVSHTRQPCYVLLHKRRVSQAAAWGEESVGVCKDCFDAFRGKKPSLSKYALANDLWLGRLDPLLWQANMTHEMCLALARTVATKVVLRAGGAQAPGSHSSSPWEHVFQQTGLVGSAVVFHNGAATHAIGSLPPTKLNDALAVTFCTELPCAEEGEEVVRRIAQLELDKPLFLEQAESLRATNPVYAAGVTDINRDLLTKWLEGRDRGVPQSILDCVVTVPVSQGDPGRMRQEGPAGATESVLPEHDPVVFALEPTVQDAGFCFCCRA